jgi:hypothetical protein
VWKRAGSVGNLEVFYVFSIDSGFTETKKVLKSDSIIGIS